MTDKQVKEQPQAEKPLSIDDLFNQLDVDLRQENYGAWSNRIKASLSSQLLRYKQIVYEIDDLKTFFFGKFDEEFDRIRFLGHIGNVRINTETDKDISERISNITPRFGIPYLSSLEQSISDLKGNIKFDSLSEEDRKRIEGVFKEQDVKTATYNYFVRRLKDDTNINLVGYNTALRNYLNSMEELAQLAEEFRDHLKLYPGRFGKRQAKTFWKERLDTLSKNLENKSSKVGSNYSNLTAISFGGYTPISFPTCVQNIPELDKLLKELEAKDQKPKIDIEKKGDGTYVISMEPTNHDYEIVKPSLILFGEYQLQLGTETKVNIDLTKPLQGDVFSNEIVQCDGKRLEVKLTVNLKENLVYKNLRLRGSYELPYLAKEMGLVGSILIAEMVKLEK